MNRSTFLKATAATAVLATVVSPVQAADQVTFTDVKESYTHAAAVYELAEAGIISGFGDGTFGPGQDVTRGQVAKIIANALDLDTTNVVDPAFIDVPATNQYYGAVAALKEAQIISGYGDNTYGVGDAVTRGQMAKIIERAFGLRDVTEAPKFTDVPDTHQYFDAVAALSSNGVALGFGDGTYGVDKNITRGQLASFITRAMEASAEEEVPTIEEPTTPEVPVTPETPEVPEETPGTEGEETPETPEEAAAFNLTVMHQNDIHANLKNMPKTVTAVESVRAENENALYLNAGDSFSGTLYFNEFEGQADIAMLNLLGVDAFTLGNHEFDLGASENGHQALVDFIKAANFPVVTSNVDVSKDAKFDGLFTDGVTETPEAGNMYSAIVKEVDGEKVGIFGLTTGETADISSPGSIVFENYIEEAQKAVDALEEQGINKIIALTHLGYDDNATVDNDLELAKHVDGIDLIVGGHSHTQLDEATVIDTNTEGEAKEATIITQAYQYNEFLGTVNVAFDENGVVIVEETASELLKIADFEANEEAAAILAPFAAKIEEMSTTSIGVETTEVLTNPRSSDEGNEAGISVRNSETALGNYITEGMLQRAQQLNQNVVMAFQNGGGIRASIDAGEVTVGEVLSVLPYGNTLATMDVTGEELKLAFEHSFKEYPKESGGFLHVAGVRVTADSAQPAGERIVSIEYKNEAGEYVAITAEETYTVATNAFTAKGGDGFDMFATAYEEGRVTDLGLSDWENFRDYLQQQTEITNTPKGTIIVK
ncbi:MAG: 5'-nucleotidase C-terminal domain-containing protein [Caryophanon sp.]|nr:5'-nucleotidase C-terminal domain-containing protein [Caryophanon sp.]